MNKKAMIVTDIMYIAVFILVLAVVVIVTGIIQNRMNEGFQGTGLDQPGKDIFNNFSERYEVVWDNIIFFVFIICALIIFVLMFMLDVHPAFYFVGVILLAFAMIPIATVGNVFDQFSHSDTISEESNQFILTTALFDNWLIIFIVIGFIGLFILFAKITT